MRQVTIPCFSSATDSSRAWYSEIANYNFVAGKFAPNTGHFTALVWKSSSSLGLGIAQSKSGKTFVVAQYSPPGNRAGQYVENVLPAQWEHLQYPLYSIPPWRSKIAFHDSSLPLWYPPSLVTHVFLFDTDKRLVPSLSSLFGFAKKKEADSCENDSSGPSRLIHLQREEEKVKRNNKWWRMKISIVIGTNNQPLLSDLANIPLHLYNFQIVWEQQDMEWTLYQSNDSRDLIETSLVSFSNHEFMANRSMLLQKEAIQ